MNKCSLCHYNFDGVCVQFNFYGTFVSDISKCDCFRKEFPFLKSQDEDLEEECFDNESSR